MYYKVLKDKKVIDVLDRLVYVKYNEKHNRFLLTDKNYAQAILSSDRKYTWHVNNLLAIPVSGYDTVELEEIDEYEYRQLKMLNGKTPQEIVEAFLLELIQEGVV